MGMEENLKKMMYPSSVFKAYLFHKDRRVSQHIVLPRDGKFTIKGNGYIINPQRIFMDKNVPCAAYASAIAEPINPLDMNEQSTLSAQDFYNAIDSSVVQDIIRSTGKQDNSMMMAVMMVGVLSLVGMIFLAYYLGGLIETQGAAISALKSALETIKSTTVIPGGSGW